jgi:hypothetical protein
MTTAGAPPPDAPAGWQSWVRASLVGAVLVTVLTAPTLTRLTTAGRLDTNDGRFSIWNIAWIGHAMLSDSATLLDANIFWPHTGTLAYSELNLVAGLLGLPWYAATGSPLAALNGAVTTALLLAFVSMWALVRRLTGSSGAGLVSATAFTFCPYVSARTPHVQLLMVFVFPLVLLAFHRAVERCTIARGAALGASLAVAALACGYYGIFAALALALFAVWFAKSTAAYWRTLAAAGLTTAVMVAPVYAAFAAARSASGAVLGERAEQAAEWSANLSSYLASSAAAHAWWLPALRAWSPWVDVLFPGAVVVVLAVLGVAARRHRPEARRVVPAYLALSLLAAWASFGPAAGLYGVLNGVVPGMGLLRAPARFGIVATFGLAVVAGFGAARLERARPWLAAVLVLVTAAELGVRTERWGWPSWPLQTTAQLSPAYARLATLSRAPLVEFPFPYVATDFHNHAHAMYWSTYHWQPLVNGYSDVIPPDFVEIALPINGFPDEASFAIMQDRQVRYVLWRVDRYDEESRRVLEQRLARYPEALRVILRTPAEWLYEIRSYP